MKHTTTKRTAPAGLTSRTHPRHLVLLVMAIGVFALGCTGTDPRDDGSRSHPGTTASSAHVRAATS
ncbi:MAG: hypothetical protein ACJ769_12510 [Chloroflexota bacterium]